MLVWPCPAPDQRSLSCLLIKFLSNSFLDEGLCSVCMCVHGGLSASNWSPTTSQKACVSVVPVTGETGVSGLKCQQLEWDCES